MVQECVDSLVGKSEMRKGTVAILWYAYVIKTESIQEMAMPFRLQHITLEQRMGIGCQCTRFHLVLASEGRE